MGKKAKEHRKRVAKRNERIAAEQKKAQKQFTKLMEEKLEMFKSKFSGLTENNNSETSTQTENGLQ
jgi:hypothetical protein